MNSAIALTERVAALAAEAKANVGANMREELELVAARLAEPLRVAVTGHVSSGKSTLVNALLQQNVAPTDAGECTQFVTEFRHAKPPAPERAEIVLHGGTTRPLEFSRGRLPSGNLGVAAKDVDVLRIWLSNSKLQDLMLIDTPGLNSAHAETAALTEQLLRIDRHSRLALRGADVVLFVLNATLQAKQVELLREYVGESGGSALTVLAILTKADLVGHVDDPWRKACELAERHGRQLQSEVAAVVPVLGLLAETAETFALNGQHAADLATLADLGVRADHPALWSPDHFCHERLPMPEERRRSLLNILDIYGLKLGIELAREGVRGAPKLQRELAERSGLNRIRESLANAFLPCADVLKISSALDQMEALSYRGQADERAAMRNLRDGIETLRIDPSMHRVAEFEALRDCLALQSDPAAKHRVTLTDDLYEDVFRLVRNTSARARCGLQPEATDEELMQKAQKFAAKWHAFGNHPYSGSAEEKIARIMERSYTLMYLQAERGSPANDP